MEASQRKCSLNDLGLGIAPQDTTSTERNGGTYHCGLTPYREAQDAQVSPPGGRLAPRELFEAVTTLRWFREEHREQAEEGSEQVRLG